MTKEENPEPYGTTVVYMCSDKTQSYWRTRHSDQTLFSVLEDYITKGITTEILDVINTYPDGPARSGVNASILWDYHLSKHSEYNINPDARRRGERKAVHLTYVYERT